MKLGVAYNIFDGEELLPYSLENMRNMVDYICVVYQTTSNFKQENNRIEQTIFDYSRDGLIDAFHFYKPNFKYNNQGQIASDNGILNEINKRNLGMDLCSQNSCDLFMTMDCDEFYDKKQFVWAKEDFIKNEYDSSFVQMKTYYKYPTLEVYPSETYYVPLFYKLKFNQDGFDLKHWTNNYPVNTDPTRRLSAGYSRIYTRDEIEMHHYAYVRKEIHSKVNNTSSQVSKEDKIKVINHWQNFKDINDGALFIGNEKHGLIKTENKFNIEI